VWWYISVVPVLRRWTEEDLEFKDSLGYIVKPYLKAKQNKTKTKELLFFGLLIEVPAPSCSYRYQLTLSSEFIICHYSKRKVLSFGIVCP
jgi:hypothetical protein